jgi:phosphoribosyl 1,2-cyclic phosphodiesterase
VARFARRHGLPVWMTRGTHAAWNDAEGIDLHFINPHQGFEIGGLQVEPYPVPHDAREPSQFVFAANGHRLGVLSDVGTVTAHMRSVLGGCDALLIESNHDARMLAEGPYPAALKRRVAGAYGHLSNDQAAALLSSIDCSRLKRLVLTHLSEQNNTPELARTCVAARLGCDPDWIACAGQDVVMPWYSLA